MRPWARLGGEGGGRAPDCMRCLITSVGTRMSDATRPDPAPAAMGARKERSEGTRAATACTHPLAPPQPLLTVEVRRLEESGTFFQSHRASRPRRVWIPTHPRVLPACLPVAPWVGLPGGCGRLRQVAGPAPDWRLLLPDGSGVGSTLKGCNTITAHL